MTDLTKQLLNYGIGGLFLLALIIAIVYGVKWHREREREHKEERQRSEQLHREEREALARVIEKQFEKTNEQNTTTQTILSKITVLLETMHK